MQNDLDDLMARMVDINLKPAIDLTALDIDTVITYHRRNRARKAAGEKPTRPSYAGPDIATVLTRLKPPPIAEGTFKRKL